MIDGPKEESGVRAAGALPDAENQRAATADEQRAVVESASKAGSVLGKDIAVDLTSFVSGHEDVPFSPAAVAFCNALLYALKDSKDRTERELTDERQRLDESRDQAAKAEKDAAVFKAERDAARREGNVRQIVGTVGGAILGFIPFADDKAGFVGALIAGIAGLALTVGAWMLRQRADP